MTVLFSIFDPSLTYPGQKKFDCGNERINKFARDSLKAQVRKSLSVAYVLTNSGQFVGFFTIAQHSISMSSLSSLQLGSLPKNIPCSRLIMLGVANEYKKKNLGLYLMREVFVVAKFIAKTVGSFGIYLDADPAAVSFYEKLGFILLEGNLSPAESPMFIPMAAIA